MESAATEACPYAPYALEPVDLVRVRLDGLTPQEAADIAWRFFEMERPMIERLLMKKLRQYRGGFNEMLGEIAWRLPGLVQSYRPGTTGRNGRVCALRTHIFTGVNWYLHKLFANSSAGRWGIPHSGGRQAKKRRHEDIADWDGAMIETVEPELLDEVQCVLRDLDPYSRSLLYMRFVCQMSLEEIGEVLDLTKSNVHKAVEAAIGVARRRAPTDLGASDEVLAFMADIRRGLR